MWWRRLRYAILLVALCAVATCPAAQRSCTVRTRAAEADALLGYLADRVAAELASTGHVPPGAAGPTPQRSCCERGGACAPDAAQWTEPGWRALGFSIDGEHRFRYQYIPDPGGQAATLRAVGDLDCQGAIRTVELVVRASGDKPSRTWSHR
jgi:hypothetical protein